MSAESGRASARPCMTTSSLGFCTTSKAPAPTLTGAAMMSTTQARASVRTSDEDCFHCERPWLELTFGAGAAQVEPPMPLRALALAHELQELAVWIRDGPEELLADPCLQVAARSQGVTL